MNSDRKLIWLGGFFDGEGCINISNPTCGHAGIVCIANTRIELLEKCIRTVSTIDATLIPRFEFVPPSVRCWWNQQKGSRFLQILLPYIHHLKQQRRAQIYLRMFNPTWIKHSNHSDERKEIWQEWLKLKELEQEEYQQLRIGHEMRVRLEAFITKSTE